MSSVWLSTLISMSPPTFKRCDDRHDLRSLLQPLHHLSLERCGIGGAPTALAGSCVRNHLIESLEARVRCRVQHFRVVEDVHDRLEIAEARCRLAEQRRVDECRRRRIEHAAIRLGLRKHGHRLGAAAAREVVHDDLYPHDPRQVRGHLAEKDVTAAAGAGVRGQHDHGLGVSSLRGGQRSSRHRRDEDSCQQSSGAAAKEIRRGHGDEYSRDALPQRCRGALLHTPSPL